MNKDDASEIKQRVSIPMSDAKRQAVKQASPAEEQSAQFPSVTVPAEKSTVRLRLCVACESQKCTKA